MARQCLQLGLPKEAAFDATVARDKEAAEEVGAFLVHFGTEESIAHTLAMLLRCGSLQRYFVVACQAVKRIVDVIPETMIDTAFVWLLEKAPCA